MQSAADYIKIIRVLNQQSGNAAVDLSEPFVLLGRARNTQSTEKLSTISTDWSNGVVGEICWVLSKKFT